MVVRPDAAGCRIGVRMEAITRRTPRTRKKRHRERKELAARFWFMDMFNDMSGGDDPAFEYKADR